MRDAGQEQPLVQPLPPTHLTSNHHTRTNYFHVELLCLLQIIERVILCDHDKWQSVLEDHQRSYPGRQDVEALKKKFSQVYYRKAPFGDPNIPVEVALAKWCKRLIGDYA